MRTLLIMAAVASFSASYAAPVPDGDVVLSIDDDGDPVGSPWRLSTDGADAPLPRGLSIAGQAVINIAVHPQGILVFNAVGFDADAPRPLVELPTESVISPFWTTLAPGVCDGVPAGTVERAGGPSSLTIIWRDMPTADCLDDEQLATFSATLSWDEEEVIRGLEFRYESLPTETLVVEPRAGIRLQDGADSSSVFELLPDDGGRLLRGRAKRLLDGSSDGEPGAWLIDLGDAGQIIGEREPEHFEDDGQTRRRPDGWREADNCPIHFNPLQEDVDQDGRGDVCDPDPDGDEVFVGDNCPLVRNRGQEDTDRDGRGDACDPDDDDDGWPDEFDRCPLHHDPSNHDLDRDGSGDICDLDIDGDDDAARFRAPLVPDTCPFVYDPARRDLDGDGLGDVCDLQPWTPCRITCAWQRDRDGDGIGDLLDICPTVQDPDQLDRDRDGVGDACDPDDDGDGLIDALQIFWRIDLGDFRGVDFAPSPRLP